MRTIAIGGVFLFLSLISFNLAAQQEWQALNAGTLSWRFEDMFFVNESTGWVVDGGGQILKTTNGGLSWAQQFYDPEVYFRSVEFFDAQIGFAGALGGVDSDARLFKTIDGGTSWTEITASLPASVVGICGMSAVGSSSLFITGTFWTGAYVMKSDDLGASWQYTDMGQYANGLVDVDFKDEMNGLLVGQSAQGTGLRAIVLGTDDGGDTWEVRATGTASQQRSWKIQYLSDDVVYASIEEFEPSPQYFKSIDGGTTWTLLNVDVEEESGTMQGIGFLTEEIGWIGGWGNLFYETLDGGITWDYQPLTGSSFNRFFKVSDTKMYTSGVNVYVYEDPDVVGVDDLNVPQPQGHSISLSDGGVNIQLVNHTYFELSIYDSMGRRIEDLRQGRGDAGSLHIPWDSSRLASGQYAVVLYTYHGYDSISVFLE